MHFCALYGYSRAKKADWKPLPTPSGDGGESESQFVWWSVLVPSKGTAFAGANSRGIKLFFSGTTRFLLVFQKKWGCIHFRDVPRFLELAEQKSEWIRRIKKSRRFRRDFLNHFYCARYSSRQSPESFIKAACSCPIFSNVIKWRKQVDKLEFGGDI